MKLGAGIAGILLGILSLLYVGLFGGIVGAVVGATNPLHNSNVAAWASMVSLLSWLAPLLAITGGIVTFSNPRIGSLLLAVSACLLLYLLGFWFVGKVFGLPIGAAALLAFFSPPSTYTDDAGPLPRRTDGFTNAAPAYFDRKKWDALVQYDGDVALVAERLRPLGSRWTDEFASSYLALNDKQYLQTIAEKIAAAAKAENEESARQRKVEEEQRAAENAYHDAKRRENSELWRGRTRAAKEQIGSRLDRIWGTRQKKAWTATCTFLVIALVIGGRSTQTYYTNLIQSRGAQADVGNVTRDFLSQSPKVAKVEPPLVVGAYALQPWTDRDGVSGTALLMYQAGGGKGWYKGWNTRIATNWKNGESAPWDVAALRFYDVPQSISEELVTLQQAHVASQIRAAPTDTARAAASEPGLTIKTADGGSIHTNDFLHNGVTIPDYQNQGIWILAGGFGPGCGSGRKCDAYQSSLFTISYYEKSGPLPSSPQGVPMFNVFLIEKPLGKARQEAEQFLLMPLGLPPQQLCRANYLVHTFRELDPNHADGHNLGFSFCPGSVRL
jgi:hypothetical protein